MTDKDFTRLLDSLNNEQIERIKAKCNWEHMSWLGVFSEFPDMFINENNMEIVLELKNK